MARILAELVTLFPNPPFRLDFTVWALRRRAHNAVDRWENGYYRRVWSIDGQAVESRLYQEGPADSPRLHLCFSSYLSPVSSAHLIAIISHTLGLEQDLCPFYAMAAQDKRLNALVTPFVGVKAPRFSNLWEALINAVANQQVSLQLGIALLNRLAETFGPTLNTNEGRYYGFPSPEDMLSTDWSSLRRLGFSQKKSQTILLLAQSFVTKDERLLNLRLQDDDAAINQLCQFRGIGRWSAEYVLLRGLGRMQIFPGDDVGARKYLKEWLGSSDSLNYTQIKQILEPWKNYAGLIYLHLLLLRLCNESMMIT